MYTSSDLSTGAQLAPGSGSWASTSDRNVKANFQNVNSHDVLERLNSISIQTWNYKTQDVSIRHIGPVAQDFYAAFNVGEDDKHITTVDADAVAFAAIQGLYEVVQEQDAEIEKLKAQSEKQQIKLERLEARVAALEQGGGTQPPARVVVSPAGAKQPPSLTEMASARVYPEQSEGLLTMTNRVDWNAAIALVIGALGVIAFERARKGGAG